MNEENKKCPYCAEEIKSEAIKCRHCGELLNSRYRAQKEFKSDYNGSKKRIESSPTFWVIILIIVIIILITIGKIREPSPTNAIDEKRDYSKNWRSPEYGYEFRELGRAIVGNGITGCGEYYVKEIRSKEYIIACSADGVNWEYYVVYPETGKVTSVNQEILDKLDTPR